ncbi:transmembrane anchor protein [Acinetobacter towneri]|uniref:transmembrane anchor protein n=1 Tax=Acinetobacter towneri TaxID=202956 RepID=UPI003215D186
MYNAQIPQDVELPSTKKLVKSTIIAAVSAVVVLVTVVMPAEYNIDPTGVGKVLGLTTMGEIKQSLAAEAENGMGDNNVGTSEEVATVSSQLSDMQNSEPLATMPGVQKESITIDLKPGQATEVKVAMPKNAQVNFNWSTSGGGLNFDSHGDPVNAPKDFYHGYGKGRNETAQQGTLTAAFDGTHGWFWRNRTQNTVTVTLNVEGQFSAMKKVF